MSALLPLRSYQRAALDAVTESLREVNRPAIVLPTGGGKTVCFAHLASEHLNGMPGTRVLVLVHTDELVQQAYRKIRDVAPHLVVGIVKAAQNDVYADVIVASVQTLRSAKRRNQITRVSLVIVDECHHATAATYRAILEHFGCMGSDPCRNCIMDPTEDPAPWCDCRSDETCSGPCRRLAHDPARCPVPKARVVAVGFTATLERGDGGPLGQIWQTVAFQRDISWMVRKRYLIPPRGKRIEVPELDLSRVRTAGGDFREGDLGEALASSFAPEIIAKAYVEHASDRKALAFFPTVASAEVAVQAFRDQGVDARVIHGGLSTHERREILAWHKPGTVLVNCMILTEGYDDPEVDCIIVARPTKSRPLYIQIVGRGLRVDPARPYDEQDCLLMDVVGVSSKLSLRSMADLSDKPVKEPRDGQTLLDLEDEFDSGEGVEQDPEDHYAGPVAVKDFDPIAASSSRAWLRTEGGAYFLPAGKEGYVFLVPAGSGPYTVAWCTKSHRTPWVCPLSVHDQDCEPRHGKLGGLTEHAGLDAELAFAWGEDLAVDMGADPYETLTKRSAPWRRKPASDAAKGEARRLGIKFPETIKGGELSDRISKVKASQRIDPIVAVLSKQVAKQEERA